VEYWSTGVLERDNAPAVLFSITPLLHYSSLSSSSNSQRITNDGKQAVGDDDKHY